MHRSPTFPFQNSGKARIEQVPARWATVNAFVEVAQNERAEKYGVDAIGDIFHGVNTRVARTTCPETLWKIAARKLDLLDSAMTLDELRVPPGNRLETLSGDRKRHHGIRINEQYRIWFRWTEKESDQVEIVDYH